MRSRLIAAVIASVTGLVVVAVILPCLNLRPVHAGEQPSVSGYKVLEPIRHGSLTVFPIVAPRSYSTGDFMTLDEGLRSGEVVVTEYGNVRGLMRRRPAHVMQLRPIAVEKPLAQLPPRFRDGRKDRWPVDRLYQSGRRC